MRTSVRLIHALRSSMPLIIIGAFVVVGVQAADLKEVTVMAPTVKTIGHDASGAPIHQVTASARVQYNPIMLTTNSGRALLQYKISEVARKLCRQIDSVAIYPAEDESTCVLRAVDGTKVQIAAAMAQQKVG
jgi:UrcA family protein